LLRRPPDRALGARGEANQAANKTVTSLRSRRGSATTSVEASVSRLYYRKVYRHDSQTLSANWPS
jgi:hypothetical protein